MLDRKRKIQEEAAAEEKRKEQKEMEDMFSDSD
jgi:hypothetical protein